MAALIGIVFSIVLVMVQLGLHFGFGQMVTAMIDHSAVDLWAVSTSTKSGARSEFSAPPATAPLPLVRNAVKKFLSRRHVLKPKTYVSMNFISTRANVRCVWR